MAFFNSTKTVVIMCMVIVLLLGILVWANWDKIGSKDDKTTGSDSTNSNVPAPNPNTDGEGE